MATRLLHIVSLASLAATSVAQPQEPDFTRTMPAQVFQEWQLSERDSATVTYDLRFPSAMAGRDRENDIVHVRAVLPAEAQGPVPAVVVLHYWGASNLRVEMNIAEALARKGMAGIVLTLPYHLQRTPEGFRSGELALRPDPSAMIDTMSQCVMDVRRAVDWVYSRPEFQHDSVGITGSSLGAIVSALTVGVEPRIRFAAFVLGGVDIAHILWHSSRVVKERDALRAKGFTESKLRDALIPIEPLTYLRNARLDSSLVIAAKHDTVVPADDARKLAGALSEPHVVWLDSGHYGGFLIQKKVQYEVVRYFQRSFAGSEYVAPKSITAPTVRVGMLLGAESGMQVAVGLELWRSNAQSDAYLALFASPRGPQAFLGMQARRGLAIGCVASRTRIGAGAVWTIVL